MNFIYNVPLESRVYGRPFVPRDRMAWEYFIYRPPDNLCGGRNIIRSFYNHFMNLPDKVFCSVARMGFRRSLTLCTYSEDLRGEEADSREDGTLEGGGHTADSNHRHLGFVEFNDAGNRGWLCLLFHTHNLFFLDRIDSMSIIMYYGLKQTNSGQGMVKSSIR